MNRGLNGLSHPTVFPRLRSMQSVCPLDAPDVSSWETRKSPAGLGLGGPILDHFDSWRRPLLWAFSTNQASYDIDRTWKSHLWTRSNWTTLANPFFGAQLLNWAPTGDFSVTAKFRALNTNLLSQQINIYAQNASGTDGVYIQCVADSGTLNCSPRMLTKDAGAFNVRGNNYSLTGSLWYLHLQRIGTLWATWFSSDGYSWGRTTTFTKSLTVGMLNLSIIYGGGAFGVSGQEIGVDWVKLNWRLFA